jgi:uncharacterized 2Fe-2S/4Fe-4S cluster protein (DUF4445 family)
METESIHGKRPWIRTVKPKLVPPSLNDNTADVDRLLRGLRAELGGDRVSADFSLVKRLPVILRELEYTVSAVVYKNDDRWHLIDVLAPDAEEIYGVALDLGSSTLVLRLINLPTAETIDEVSFDNPQIEIGSDILMRIHYAGQEGGLSRLQGMLMDGLNHQMKQLAHRHNIDPRSIVGMSLAGNTTMTHLFLGLDPYFLCREPYIPVVNRPDLISAGELGLSINPGAPVLIFPNVGSYFGGDLIAGILASGMTASEEIAFLVDVGTNAEVVIGNKDWLMACAGAAGPALEGGVADMGMMAGPGVIDHVTIDPETLAFSIGTIMGDSAVKKAQPDGPVGICGSGLIDLAAQLFMAGMIDLRGKFVPEMCGDRLVDEDGIAQLVVVDAASSGTDKALTLSQTDLDGLIRSKAAMYTILTTISNTVGVSFQDIHRFYVAGTFGSYIDPRSAITIGMIPDLPMKTYVSLGNTSLKGASMALMDEMAMAEAFTLRDRITYLELNVNQEFMNLFSAAKFLPHTDCTLFPSVKAGAA